MAFPYPFRLSSLCFETVIPANPEGIPSFPLQSGDSVGHRPASSAQLAFLSPFFAQRQGLRGRPCPCCPQRLALGVVPLLQPRKGLVFSALPCPRCCIGKLKSKLPAWATNHVLYLSCGALTLAAGRINACTSYPAASRSVCTSSNTSPSDQEVMPRTFSPTTQRGETSRMILSISGHRWRSSSFPSRFPALLYGWQGKPPVIMSIRPAYPVASNRLISSYPVASGKWCFSVFWQKGFISHHAIVFQPAQRAASEKPPIPAKRSRCVIFAMICPREKQYALSANEFYFIFYAAPPCGACEAEVYAFRPYLFAPVVHLPNPRFHYRRA